MIKQVRAGERHPKSKLNRSKVTMIRSLHEQFGWGYKRLSKRFEVSIRTIRCVVHYETWCN